MPSTTIVDTSLPSQPDICTGETSIAGLSYDAIYVLCFSGERIDTIPEIPEGTIFTVPWSDRLGNESDVAYSPEAEGLTADRWFQAIQHATPGVPMVDNDPLDGDIWDWVHDGACVSASDEVLYPDKQYAYYYSESGSLAWTWGAAVDSTVCSTLDFDYLPFPPPEPSTGASTISGAQDCAAGTADFDLGWRVITAADADFMSGQVVPLLTTQGVSIPERAWIRSLEVLDWGSADNLQIAPTAFDAHLKWSGWHVANTTQEILKPASGPSTTTWSAGQVAYSNLFAIEKLDLTGSTVSLPELRISWSCEVNAQAPHFSTPSGYSGFATLIPAIAPIESRIVFWVGSGGDEVFIGPEGRWRDMFRSSLETDPAGGKRFTIAIPTYDVTFTGRLVPHASGSYRLRDAVAVVGTGNYTVQDRVLSPL